LERNDSRHLKVSLRRIGRDRNPLLVIDNVLANAEEIRRQALGYQFKPARIGNGYYPGYLLPSPLRGMTALARWAAKLIWDGAYAKDGLEASGLDELDVESFFAIYSPAPGQEYAHIHTDGDNWLAMVLHLSHGLDKRAGTAFWRHQPTGLESIYNGEEPVRAATIIEACFGVDVLDRPRAAAVQRSTLGLAAWQRSLTPVRKTPFPATDHDAFKRIGYVPSRFNRLVVYPAWQLHSIAMSEQRTAPKLEAARLTLNGNVRHPLLERHPRMPVSPIAELED